jgi:hypothetical protein
MLLLKKIKEVHKTRYVLYKETLVDFKENFWAFLGSFAGIGIIIVCNLKRCILM